MPFQHFWIIDRPNFQCEARQKIFFDVFLLLLLLANMSGHQNKVCRFYRREFPHICSLIKVQEVLIVLLWYRRESRTFESLNINIRMPRRWSILRGRQRFSHLQVVVNTH